MYHIVFIHSSGGQRPLTPKSSEPSMAEAGSDCHFSLKEAVVYLDLQGRWVTQEATVYRVWGAQDYGL